MFVLAVNCQRDESADIDADRGLPSTEVSPRQLQNRAREIVSSEEFDELLSVNISFLDKIHDKKMFLEEGLVDNNGEFNENVLKERLSYTSFQSVDEFFQELEEVLTISGKFGGKYDNLQDPLLQEEIYKALENTDNIDNMIRKGTVDQCISIFNRCETRAYIKFAIGNTYCCVIGAMGNPICGFICAGINFVYVWLLTFVGTIIGLVLEEDRMCHGRDEKIIR